MVEIEDAGRCLLEELAGAVAEEFVDADLDFEGRVAVFLVEFQIFGMNEGDGLVGCFCTQHIAQGDVFESDLLSDVIVIRY